MRISVQGYPSQFKCALHPSDSKSLMGTDVLLDLRLASLLWYRLWMLNERMEMTTMMMEELLQPPAVEESNFKADP